MGGISGVIAGLIGSGQGEKSIDMSQLLATIKGAGQYQQQIINALPPEIQKNLKTFAASQNQAGQTYQGNVQGMNTDYLSKVGSLYGPGSEAANLAKNATREDIYSTVPGTQDAIRNAMASTGGLARGNAGVALSQPYVQAAQQYGSAAGKINASQAAMGQQATQQALTQIQSIDANMFQQLFGMSKEQATQIMQTGNDALRQQLAQLITQSVTQTNQELGVEGIQAQNAYQNALQQQGYQNAIYNGLANTAVSGAEAYATGGTSGGVPGMDVGSADYMRNAMANRPAGAY